MPLRVLSWFAFVVLATTLVIVLVGQSVTPSASASPSGVLRVGYALEPPYAMRDLQGQMRGEAVEVLRAVLRRLGQPEPVWVHAERSRLLHELRMGRIDIATGVFITPQQATRVDFTHPTTTVRTALLVARDNPLKLHSLDAIRSHPSAHLAVIDGSGELVLARWAGLDQPQLLCLPDLDSALSALREGRAAALALPAPRLQDVLATTDLAHGWEAATPFSTPRREDGPDIDYPAFALRRGDPLRERFDSVLKDYLGSREHLDLARRHGFSPEDVAASHGFQLPVPAAGATPR